MKCGHSPLPPSDITTTKIHPLVANSLGSIRRFVGHTERVNCCDFSFNGNVAGTGSYDGTCRLWDIRSNDKSGGGGGKGSSSSSCIQILKALKNADSITQVIMPGEGNCQYTVVTGSTDCCIRTFDIRNGKCETLTLSSPITGLSLSKVLPDKLLIASYLDGGIRLIDKERGEVLSVYEGSHKAGNYSLRCSLFADDSCIFSGASGSSIVFSSTNAL